MRWHLAVGSIPPWLTPLSGFVLLKREESLPFRWAVTPIR
jgi:hypothetical protein